MKHLLRYTVYFTAYAWFFSVPSEAQVTWLQSLKEAKEQARQENKFILADFWASWCGPCIRMDKDVWNRIWIESLSENFVCVRVDFDKRRNLAGWYGVTAIPAVLFLDAYGNKLIHIIGYRSAKEMAQIMTVLPDDVSDIYDLQERMEKEKNAPELMIDLADRYRSYGMSIPSNKYYKKASKSKKVRQNPEMLDRVMTFTALNSLFLDEPKKARKLFEKCLEEAPNSENRALQLFCLVKAHVTLGKEKMAREYYATLQKEFPDDKHTMWADELMNGSN